MFDGHEVLQLSLFVVSDIADSQDAAASSEASQREASFIQAFILACEAFAHQLHLAAIVKKVRGFLANQD